MPIEYLPKQQRIELAQRALKLERAVKLMSAKGVSATELAERRQAREVLRRFSATVFREVHASAVRSSPLCRRSISWLTIRYHPQSVDQSILDYLMVQSPSDYLEETFIIGQSLARSTKSLLESSYKCGTHLFSI